MAIQDIQIRASNLLKFLCVFHIIFITSSNYSAYAEECQAPTEAIEKLFPPRLGTYSLWDLINGVPNMSQSFTDFIMRNEAEVVLAGYQENKKIKRPIIRKMDRRGRVIWTWIDKNQIGLSRPIKIEKLIEESDGFLAVGQIYGGQKPKSIWLARFNYDGKKLQEKIIFQKSSHFKFGDVIEKPSLKGWMLAVNERHGNQSPYNSRFILLNRNFETTQSRAFLPGPENQIHAIDLMKDLNGQYHYIAVGEIGDGYDRTSGLVMRIDTDNNIAWQRNYPRGNGLRFNGVSINNVRDVLVTGEAQPLTEDAPKAASVMKLDADNGAEIWQRYYSRDDTDYIGKSIVTRKDGRTHILLSGTGTTHPNHARIISLSPRGQIMNEISYTTGNALLPETLKIAQDSSLLLSGMATIDIPDPDDPQNKTKLSKQGWFLVGEKVGEYEDPCVPKKQIF